MFDIIDTFIYHIGTEPIAPCRDCRACTKLQKCIIDDKVNELLATIKDYDGLVIGSPVHYASASGVISPFLDRLFFAGSRIPRVYICSDGIIKAVFTDDPNPTYEDMSSVLSELI